MQLMETFVIRVWVPSEAADDRLVQLCGFVEHPRTEQRWKFAGEEELLEQLAQTLYALAPPTLSNPYRSH